MISTHKFQSYTYMYVYNSKYTLYEYNNIVNTQATAHLLIPHAISHYQKKGNTMYMCGKKDKITNRNTSCEKKSPRATDEHMIITVIQI